MADPPWTAQPFAEALPSLLEERQWTLKQLAREAGVSDSHLSRGLRQQQYKSLSGELVGRLTVALGLPSGYFPEEREWVALRYVRENAALRDRLYSSAIQDRADPPDVDHDAR